MSSVTIARGRAIIYRLFDVAEEIDLRAVEEILRHRAAAGRVTIANPSVTLRDAPVSLSLGNTSLRLGSRQIQVETYARLWNYGAVSLQFHVGIAPGTTWPELVELAALAEDDTNASDRARDRLAELRAVIEKAFRLPHQPEVEEDYIIYLIEEINGSTAADLGANADIPALILGETSRPLSEQTRRIIMQSAHGYSQQDLAIVDWNSALVVDPAGGRDAADVLEFAVTHLMEFRYFDDLLDQRLERLYDSVEKHRGSWLLRRDYELLSREATTLYVEFTDYRERVENSIKFFGDSYLASIFRTAVERFNLREWEESVSRKLGTLAQTSQLLQGEVNVRRSHFLELVIIALIAYEIISALL